MFQSTIPFGEPELLRASSYLEALDEEPGSSTTSDQLATASPSLMADLQRFEHRPGGADVLEVLAACLRHSHSAAVQLDAEGFVVPLTVFPRERLYHCPADAQSYLEERLATLKVLRVELAVLRPPGDREEQLVAPLEAYHPMSPLLWELSQQHSRNELLPEIAGPACYRTAPGVPVESLRLRPGHRLAMERMRSHPTTLRELAELPGLDRDKAARLLNGLYLQAGLIISRTLPAALSAAGLTEGWLPALRRRR